MDLQNTYIGFDRDGTLEMPGHPAPEKLMNQFDQLRARGATLFIASGRSHEQLQTMCHNIRLMPKIYCAEHGSHIVIPEQNIESFCGDQHYPDFQYFLDSVATLPLPSHRPESKRFVWAKVFNQAEQAAEILEDFIKTHRLQLSVFCYAYSGSIEVLPIEISKVKVLSHIPEHAKIHYIGDSENDLTLMQDARVIPHAVGNAKEVVKICVNQKKGLISKSSVGVGVSEILENLFFR